MARIRTIKPEYFTSEQIVSVPVGARLLFIGLWCFSDDNGVHPASHRRLLMEVFPGDDDVTAGDVKDWMNRLIEVGLVRLFEADGAQYWAVTGWKKHQVINRPTFRHPAPPKWETSMSTHGALMEHSLREGKGRDTGREEKGKGSGKSEAKSETENEPESKFALSAEPKTESASEPGPELRAVLEWWNGLADAGLVAARVHVAKPSEAVVGALRKAMREPKRRQALEDLQGLRGVIERSGFVHRQGWFTLPWLLVGKNKNGELHIEKLMNGGFIENDHSGKKRKSDPRIEDYQEF